MSRKVSPLRPKGGEQSALARIDITAIELLSEGLATSLQTARVEVILADLLQRRDEMTTLLSDLRGRGSTGVLQLDAANAHLITAIGRGIVQIDLFIARARDLSKRIERPGAPQPAPSGRALKGI